MDAVGKIIGLSLLMFVGCLSTVPTGFQFAPPDPFAVAPPDHFALEPPLETDKNVSDPAFDSIVPEKTVEDQTITEPAETPLEELVFEPEGVSITTEAEQLELLSQNNWVKNIALINLLDSGKKPSLGDLSPTDRQRRDEINRLNMSQEELAKKQNKKFEYVDGSASDSRWMHRGVDKLHAMPLELRESAEVFLRGKYKDKKYLTLRINAAILLGRDGNPAIKKYLLQLVQSETVPIPLRCAAIEVLGRMSMVTADDLIPLIENVKDRTVEKTVRKTGEQIKQLQAGNIDVWEELLLAISEKIDPWEHDCFLEPFHAVTIDIRLVAAKIWRRKSLEKRPDGRTLPDKFLEIAQQEGNPLMRVEIIRTLGAWNVPNLYEFLENDMRHRTAEVRNAAMLALADAKSRDAMPLIKDQLRDSNGATRAAAVSALRKLGAYDEVFKLMGDQDRLVRLEIAPAFAERCTSQTVTIAKSFLSDRDAKVQSATIEAVAGWSIEESGSLLLSAVKSFHPDVRRRAVELLAERGVALDGFDPEEKPENQTAQYQELVQVFRETTGIDPDLELSNKARAVKEDSAIRQVSASVPESSELAEVRRCLDDWQDRTLPQEQRELIERRLASRGQELIPLIDHLLTVENRNIPESLDKVFAEAEPMFRQIENLKSEDIVTQRRGASELAKSGAVSSPSKLVSKRIVDLAAKRTDPLVLVSLLAALKNSDPDMVRQLARPLLCSESAEVRRFSCEMLKQFGTSEDVDALHDTLHDSSQVVVRGALQAIDTLLEESGTENASVIETLKGMLQIDDPRLQTDVAATLHRRGRSEGTDALRRLAASSDVNVKAYVATTITGLGDPAFVPILTRFLDDGNATVRNKALEGLPKLTEQDVGRKSKTLSGVSQTQQKIDHWRSWAKEQ